MATPSADRPDVFPPARIAFRQPVTTEPHVDAAWWPRSRDLEKELPALLDVLWTADRTVTRVSYHVDSWLPTPRRLVIEGVLVRLGAFRQQDPALLCLRDARGGERIDVLVIPPDATELLAARAMDLACAGGPNGRAGTLLDRAGG